MISAKVPCSIHPEEAILPLRWLCQLPLCGLAAEPKQWEIREINEIMNNSIEGWTAFSNPRIFVKYGRQRGWERSASGNEQAATGSDLPDGFCEVTEEEAQQMELPL